MGDVILKVTDLTKNFGGLYAVNSCSFEIEEGIIFGLIGPNGAGKTTTYNLICGNLKPARGEVWFQHENITGLSPRLIARKGAVRTFQISRVFKGMTVLENILVPPPPDGRPRISRQKAQDLLGIVGLKGQSGVKAGNLSYGQQKLLEFVRIFVLEPKLVLLDEIFSGLNSDEIERQMKIIRDFRTRTGVTFVIIDHAVSVVLRLCEQIIVMNQGEIIATGNPEQIENNQEVIDAYLGSDTHWSLMEEP
jgi:branched-chain amino acid transport system ATP-binding protein